MATKLNYDNWDLIHNVGMELQWNKITRSPNFKEWSTEIVKKALDKDYNDLTVEQKKYLKSIWDMVIS
jgi:hypothetical protein